MKKLVLILALSILPLSATAGEVSDMILSATGTLYTISSEVPPADSGVEASKQLILTERRGDEIRREVVPASTQSGSHTNGLLGYDPESGTMFVFWVQHCGFLYNQLLFCARDGSGTWSEATAFVENDLVDELNLVVFPVIVGDGTRLFATKSLDTALELVESRTTPKGVTIQVYRNAGRPEYGTAEVE